MLMVRLVLDLLHEDRRSSGGPVPVLASLASWDPVSQDLHDWLGAMLITDYPALAGTPPPGSAGDNLFEALMEARLILPVLDGLDEIPESARGRAIDRINRELNPGEHVVVTCRTNEYQAAVGSQDGRGTALRAAAVQLRTLEFDEVARYLHEDAGLAGAGRWDFLDTLSAESPVRQALATPLMADLARAIYNSRPGERAGDLRDPANELCKRDLADRAAVEVQLFDAFIPAAYRSSTRSRWTGEQAEEWLVFLARHLEQTIRGSDLAWWQLREAVPNIAFKLGCGLSNGLAFGLVAGLVAGLGAKLAFGLAAGLAAGLGVGLACVLIFGLMFGNEGSGRSSGAEAPAYGVRISIGELVGQIGGGLAIGIIIDLGFGLALGLVAVFVPKSRHGTSIALGLLVLAVGLAIGLAAGLVAGLGYALEGVPGDLAGATSPQAVLARDRQATRLLTFAGGLVFGLVAGLVAGLVFGLAGGLVFGLVFGLVAGLVGLVGGLASGLGTGLRAGPRGSQLDAGGELAGQTAWPSYMIGRSWLAFHHHLPWSLMSFLADAHKRGVLRQAGAVYQFRHIELQHRLANRDASGEEVSSPATPSAADA